MYTYYYNEPGLLDRRLSLQIRTPFKKIKPQLSRFNYLKFTLSRVEQLATRMLNNA